MSAFSLAQIDSLPVAPGDGIGIFDSGSGGMVTAGFVARMLEENGLPASAIFFGDTANLPYGTRKQENVAALSDAIIRHLGRLCPVIGIACNTASAAWQHYGTAGKDAAVGPQVFSVVQVAAEQAYARARIVPDTTLARGKPVKIIGVLGTALTATIQSHAEAIVALFRADISRAIGHELPLVPYSFGPDGPKPDLPSSVIDTAHTPHVAVLREDEAAPGGTTRAAVMHWTPPDHLPQGVGIVARDAQELVKAVDVVHVLNDDGLVKPSFRALVEDYLRSHVRLLAERHATALILGCTHFEYFERDFARLLPTIAAGGGIVSPSGALAMRLMDAWRAHAIGQVRPMMATRGAYFGYSGTAPPEAMFRSLGLTNATMVAALKQASKLN